MVDTLLHADETSARCSFHIPADHVMVDNGIFTEGGLLENMAQTAAAHAGYLALSGNGLVKAGFIASVKDFIIFKSVNAGDHLQTSVVIESDFAGINIANGTVWHNEELVASCELKIFIQES